MVFFQSHWFRKCFSNLTCATRDWLAYRSLLALASKQSFQGLNPQRASRIIQRIAQSRFLQNASVVSASQYALDPRPLTCKHALMRVWELAEVEAKRSTQMRFKWHRVMASCNALYEGFETLPPGRLGVREVRTSSAPHALATLSNA